MPEEVAQENEEKEGTKKKKGKFKFVLIIIVCVILLGLGGGYFLYGNVLIQKFLGKEPQEAVKNEVKKAEVPMGPIMALEPFLFNISNADMPRFP